MKKVLALKGKIDPIEMASIPYLVAELVNRDMTGGAIFAILSNKGIQIKGSALRLTLDGLVSDGVLVEKGFLPNESKIYLNRFYSIPEEGKRDYYCSA